MKRTFKYALGVVLASAFVLPAAYAQSDNFPDVPDNHWAYEALARMKKDGLLIGYPDGLFRGGRPATRYEMAVACHAVYTALRTMTDGIDTRVKSLEEKLGGTGTDNTGSINELKADVAAMKGWGQTIADLKKMADKFDSELTTMGVDVEAMKKKLGDLEDRVSTLEKRKLPVNISGDVNFVVIGGYASSGTFGITTDGRPTGVGRGSYGSGTLDGAARVGAWRDLTVLHEEAITLKSTNDTGTKWVGTMVYTNDLNGNGSNGNGRAFGAGGVLNAGVPFNEGTQSVIIPELYAMFDSSLMNHSFSATLGRQGVKVSPYSFMRPDTTPFYANERADNGKYAVDGVDLGLGFGNAKLHLIGGRLNAARGGSSDGTGFQQVWAGRTVAPFTGGLRPRYLGNDASGAILVDQMFGITASLPVSQFGVNLNYLWLSSNGFGTTGAANYNGVNVYGGDVKLNLMGKFDVNAGYSKSDVVYNARNVLNKNNDAYWGGFSYGKDKWGLTAGYKQINPFFAAPGDWGRIGIWYNPSDIKGGYAKFNFDPSTGVKLTGAVDILTGTGKGGVLTTGDKLNHYNVELGYKLSGNDLTLGFEDVEWKLAGTGLKPHERWYNIGVGFNLAENTKWSFLWQISDYDSKGAAGFNPFTGSAQTTAKGGVLSTQFSVKF